MFNRSGLKRSQIDGQVTFQINFDVGHIKYCRSRPPAIPNGCACDANLKTIRPASTTNQRIKDESIGLLIAWCLECSFILRLRKGPPDSQHQQCESGHRSRGPTGLSVLYGHPLLGTCAVAVLRIYDQTTATCAEILLSVICPTKVTVPKELARMAFVS